MLTAIPLDKKRTASIAAARSRKRSASSPLTPRPF